MAVTYGTWMSNYTLYFGGLVKDCCNSNALTMEFTAVLH